MAPGKPFKAIIIGGSVSGMTMAHMLERAGIDYIVLERGSEVTFNGGASIGLQPHGLRIMDQMGMYEDILKTTTPMALACHRLPNGKAFARSEFTLEIEERHGYPILFFERAEMLEILYKHLPDKSKILCSKKVVDIQSNSEGAVATTADGTSYSADMIIGADGVHSTTRQAMWKIMEKTEPNLVKKERSSMFSEYACAFGVSIYDSPDEDLKPGYSHINYEEQRSHICIVSTRKRKFWFLIVKHDKRYYTPNIPRFTPADTEAIIHKNSDIRVTERTTLGDLWKHRSKCSMVSLEEVMFNRWYEDRLVLLGDAVHKVTPNAGHGGNTAIESAAVLANLLYDAKNAPSGRKSLTHKGLLAVFREYQASRMARVANACEKSSMATRLQAMDSMLWKNLALRIVPALGESMEVNAASALIIGGEPLKSVEYKGKQGSIPWDGWDSAQEYQPRKNTFFTGALQSRRFLAVLLAIAWALQHQYAPPAIPVLQHTDGVGMEPYLSNNKTGAFSGWLQEYGASTMPTNPWNTLESSVQMLSIGVILAVEQFRGFSAKKHHVDLLVAGAAFRLGGIGLVGPLYFLSNAFETYLDPAPNRRGNVVPIAVAKLLPTAFLVSVIINAALLSGLPKPIWPISDRVYERIFAASIQLSPVMPSIVARILSIFTSSEAEKPIMGHTDLESLQKAYLLSGLLSAAAHILGTAFALITPRSTASNLSTGQWFLTLLLGASGLEGSLRSSYMAFASAAMLWVYWSCRMAVPANSRTVFSNFKLALVVASSLALAGPGATASLFWLWREDKTRCDKETAAKFQKTLRRD